MDSEICMWKTGIMTTSDYKNFFLNASLPLMINSYPKHFSQDFKNSIEEKAWVWHHPQDFHFKLHLILKKVVKI